MNEYLYAKFLKESLEEFKAERLRDERFKDENYICVYQYLNIDELKKENLDVEFFMKFCRKMGLKVDYPQNLEECRKKEYEGKNLIAIVLH